MRALVRLVAMMLALLVPWLASTPARADDALIASEPRAHQVMDRPPGWVTLAFDRLVNEDAARIFVLNSEGRNVTLGALLVEQTNVSIQLQNGLSKGTYTVMYRINGENGQPRGGAYQFAYGRGDWTTIDKPTWVGSENEPNVFQGANPNEPKDPTEPPATTGPDDTTPTGPPIDVETSTSTTSPSLTPVPSTSPSPSARPATGDGGQPLLVIGLVIAGSAALAGAGFVVWRGRRRA